MFPGAEFVEPQSNSDTDTDADAGSFYYSEWTERSIGPSCNKTFAKAGIGCTVSHRRWTGGRRTNEHKKRDKKKPVYQQIITARSNSHPFQMSQALL